MSESTTNKQRELLSTQGNVENNHNKSSTLVERKIIEGTPFTVIKQYDQWFMVMGNYKITDNTETEEETLEKLTTEFWNIVTTMIIIIVKSEIQIQTQNPIIHEMDEPPYGEDKDHEWESPRDREKRTRQEYKPIK